MRHLFSNLYQKIMRASEHRLAPYYLFLLSFAESSFFPIPPDVMLAPMTLAKPQYGWRYACITTIASVMGGVAGYYIGAIAFALISPYLIGSGYEHLYHVITHAFEKFGFWITLVAGFAPIPYKLFTIGAGATHISLIPFILGSLIGRGSRFFTVVALMKWKGAQMQRLLLEFIDRIGWIILLLILIAIVIWYNYR